MQPSATRTSDHIAANVRAELAAQRLTQKALAEAMGWSEGKTSRLVRGGAAWDVEEASAVAQFLGLPDVRYLLAERAA